MAQKCARAGSATLLSLVVVGLGLAAAPAAAGGASPGAAAGGAGYGVMPLVFVPNQGQYDERVAFAVEGMTTSILFTAAGLTYVLSEPGRAVAAGAADRQGLAHAVAGGRDALRRRWAVALDFVGARADARPESLAAAETVVSFFTGPPQQWRAGLRASSKIAYRELWPGVDLVLHGTVDRLKYEFVVRPGADPSVIRLAYRGAERVELDRAGRLRVTTPIGSFEDDAPVAWQEVGGGLVEVPVAFALDGGGGGVRAVAATEEATEYGFELAPYDRSRTLVIDPAVLVYSGFLGSWSSDSAYAVAVDDAGAAYVTGPTHSDGTDFPAAVGPDLVANGYFDAFVAKVNPAGTALEYCGYIGGDFHDYAHGIAVDASGNAYVVGSTESGTTFPSLVGPSLTPSSQDEVFVTKVNPSGTALVYSGFIGGTGNEAGRAVTVDAQGAAYVTGFTVSTNLPTSAGPDLTHNGGADAFVAKVNSTGSGLVYCGYLGGSGADWGEGIAVDAQGRAYVTGYTGSSNFPKVVGPSLTFSGGATDAFATRVSADGSTLQFSGFIGGSSDDEGKGIAVDSLGQAHVAGKWGSDAFVVKLSATGSGLLSYGGTIGGSGDDTAEGIVLDRAGRASLVGVTASADFPVVDSPGSYGGMKDAFVARVNAAGNIFVNSGYLGGSDDDSGYGIAVDPWDNIYVVGATRSSASSFPVLRGPDLTHNGGSDAFVTKISDSAFVFADGFGSGSFAAWSAAAP